MENNDRLNEINKVTIVGFFTNLILTIGKILAGIIGKSGAMLADGIHSLSDFATDIIVLVFVRVSSKDNDSNHQYGHGKFETFATMLISFALMIVGIGIFWTGFEKVVDALNGEIIEQPGFVALAAAIISIISKETLYWYTINTGKKINSQAVIANAWHHRSDALSSIGAAIGISGAIYLGDQWRILDPIAGIIVSIFIVNVAWSLATPSVKELLENSLPEKMEDEISSIIESVSGVKGYHNLRTRKIGNSVAIEAHVKVDKYLSVEDSHNIASEIEKLLRKKYGTQTHTGIHIEPFYES
ncbi:MAG: cation diffusion facilitator family transporter [Bacteroidetes bacterium]|nr:cation diffusion facilitator family transporter [Bacteroidota bacterium]MBU1680400.1 cation diffusion facilitator family transporter [Bacteroidota bacterium]MBU2506501.1 cation diffusion facilitator family transporter [Bacteroidota bacterium]